MHPFARAVLRMMRGRLKSILRATCFTSAFELGMMEAIETGVQKRLKKRTLMKVGIVSCWLALVQSDVSPPRARLRPE